MWSLLLSVLHTASYGSSSPSSLGAVSGAYRRDILGAVVAAQRIIIVVGRSQ